MRYLKYLFLAALAVVLLTVSLANRGTVTLRLLPEELGAFAGVNWAVNLPLFLVVLIGVVIGLLVGFLWEWLREHKHRAAAAEAQRKAARFEREVAQIRARQGSTEDEVLALLEQPRKAG
jgi:uncharacterized integral membrane protein